MSNQGWQPQNPQPPQGWPANPTAAQGPYVPGQDGTRPQGQPYPGQPGYEPAGPADRIPPAGQGYPAQGYPAQGYAGQGYPQPFPGPGGPTKPSRSPLVLALVLVGAVLVIGLALAMVLFGLRGRTTDVPAPATTAPATPAAPASSTPVPSSSAPTPSATGPTTPLSSSYVSLTAPSGWSKAADSGDGNEIKIVDAQDNDITVYLLSPHRNGNLATVCKNEMDAIKIWVPGEISKLPDRTIGGKKAVGYALAGNHQHVMYCIAHAGEVFTINSEATSESKDKVASAYDFVLATIKWTS